MPELSDLIAELRDDYTRHGESLKNPAVWALGVYRFGVWSSDIKGPIGRLASKLYGAMFLGVQLTTGMVLHREARIGKALYIVHWGNTRVHPNAVIGDRCGLMHDVTIGTNMEREGVPVLGDDVFVGAGAKILGPVRIGSGARIAANSLVLQDVPDGATAVGVPARILRYTGRPSSDPEAAPPPNEAGNGASRRA
jgi:serine O-acetyltransferase